MKRLTFLRLAVCALALLALNIPLFAQSKAGAIKAARVTGDVIRIAADGTESPVAEGQALIESDVVRTGNNAGVVLVFANGSSVKVGETSRLAIEEFKMDPLDEDIAVAGLEKEPTVSRTRLNLAYGEMVGNVKKLNASSSYDIKTPVGAAGIRGTTFRIVLRFDATGQVNFVLSTLEGRVVFAGTIPTVGGETASVGEQVNVDGGAEVIAIAQVDTTTNTVTSVQVAPVQTISPAAQTAITNAVTQAIQQASQSTNFTSTDQQQASQKTTTTPPSDQTPGAQTSEQSSNQNQQNQNRPNTTQPVLLDTTARSGSGS